jgi:hypothetical protein
VPGIGCGSPRPLGYTHATQLLNDGVPFHVVQRYLGHQRPEMTARCAATLAATAAAEFLKPSAPRCSIRHVAPAHRIWPDVPFCENDAAKAAGARTDPGRRSCSRRGIPGSRQLKRQGTA